MAKRFKGDSEKPRNMLSMFLNTPVGDHIPRGTTGDVAVRKVGPVLVVHRNESLPRVFRKLTVEGFLSAPVVDGRRYVDFIDMMDMVQATKDLFWGDSTEVWTDFWEKEKRFSSTTVGDVLSKNNMGLFDRKAAPAIDSDYSSFHALEMMVRNEYHRLAVVKPGTSTIENILTQSMFISWLRQHKSLLAPLRNLTVRGLSDEATGGAITINQNEKAINAFNRMATEKISGLAVVDDDGLLVSTISVRDLRTVGTSGAFFFRLFRPIREFKRLAREEHSHLAPRTHYSTKLVPRKGLFVTPDDNVETVINKMYDGNIHRVWVCESTDNPRPIGVLSQIDVLRIVLDECITEAS